MCCTMYKNIKLAVQSYCTIKKLKEKTLSHFHIHQGIHYPGNNRYVCLYNTSNFIKAHMALGF